MTYCVDDLTEHSEMAVGSGLGAPPVDEGVCADVMPCSRAATATKRVVRAMVVKGREELASASVPG